MTLKEQLDAIERGIKTGQETFKATEGRILQFDERMTAIETMVKKRQVSLPGVELEKDKFSFARAIYAISTKDWRNAPFEKAVFEETEKQRDLSAGLDSGGGFLVPAEISNQLIELLRSKTVVVESGATVMDGLVGSPVELPKQTGGATATFIGESATITPSDQVFGQVNLTPHQGAAFTKMSNRVLRLSNPGIENIVREDLTKVLARLIDLAALRGDGASNFPVGIANTPGIGTVSAGTPNGGPVTYNLLVDLIDQLDSADALEGSLGWVFHTKIRRKIAQLKDSDGRPLFTWDPSLKQPSTLLLGYPWKTTTQIPINLSEGSSSTLSEIYFANWVELIWASWGGMQLDASNVAGDSFEKNQTFIRIINEIDIALRHEESFALSNDVETA